MRTPEEEEPDVYITQTTSTHTQIEPLRHREGQQSGGQARQTVPSPVFECLLRLEMEPKEDKVTESKKRKEKRINGKRNRK